MKSNKSLINKAQLHWDKLFWSPIDSRDMGLFRILYCACILLVSWDRFNDWARFVSDGTLSVKWSWLAASGAMGLSSWKWISLAWFLSLALALLGVFTRTALFSALVCLAFLIAPLSPTPYDSSIVFLTLCVLLFTPGIQAYGLDSLRCRVEKTIPSWPRQLILISIASAYLAQAFNKLFFMGGFAWLNGETLQVWFRRYYYMYGSVFAEAVSTRPWLAQALSLYTILFELMFCLIFFKPRWKNWLVPLALMFHVGVYVAMKVVFIFFFCPSYLVLIDSGKIRRGWAALKR